MAEFTQEPRLALQLPIATNAVLSHAENMSLCCMYGLPADVAPLTPTGTEPKQKITVTTVAGFVEALNYIFSTCIGDSEEAWAERKGRLVDLMKRLEFLPTELTKYIHFDNVIPYTRNLIATDEKEYTLLLLCWSAGIESRIHDHPGKGCFVKVVDGQVTETRYSVDTDKDQIVLQCCNEYKAGSVSYMSDQMGLHKIGNPDKLRGAVSLHLYVPPFDTCKVWAQAGKLSESVQGRITHFSEYGVRSSAQDMTSDQLAYYI